MSLLQLAEESNIIQAELGLVVLLFIAAFVAIFVRRFQRIPYTTALVVVGLGLALMPNFLKFGLWRGCNSGGAGAAAAV
ncbi:MAG: hypothetical protein HF973_15175 [Chloroflexi bacterium]|nr:hypothetical protein [Chloroflexota bacterium]